MLRPACLYTEVYIYLNKRKLLNGCVFHEFHHEHTGAGGLTAKQQASVFGLMPGYIITML